MTTILWSEHDPETGAIRNKGKFNTNQGAVTGSWCAAPLLPDRCKCFDSKTMLNHPAEGYIEAKKPDKQGRLWRDGICHRCHPELVQDARKSVSKQIHKI